MPHATDTSTAAPAGMWLRVLTFGAFRSVAGMTVINAADGLERGTRTRWWWVAMAVFAIGAAADQG